MSGLLHELLDQAVATYGENIAIEELSGAVISYRELGARSEGIRDSLLAMGVSRGDRVGLLLPKSIGAVSGIYGILKAGAAYVPIPATPLPRALQIVRDCTPRVVIAEPSLAAPLHSALRAAFTNGTRPPAVLALSSATIEPVALDRLPSIDGAGERSGPRDDDLAYILYTSGSTGRPKGVTWCHSAALSFVRWCSETFAPTQESRFTSHAPFHFDLSILDLYLSCRHGGRVVLIDDATAKDPRSVAQVISSRRISNWYSTPAALRLLVDSGSLNGADLGALESVLFAGEVYPLRHLKSLRALLPRATRLFNLYGPTETNVCTAFSVPRELDDWVDDIPIGRPCSHLQVGLVGTDNRLLQSTGEGELVVRGPGIMRGYWNRPDENERTSYTDEEGTRWYRTGDWALRNAEDLLYFRGRRDRRIKKRGYRIELGEIEACLNTHPSVRDVAVIAKTDALQETRVLAFVALMSGTTLSIVAAKRFCAERLPLYMVPDAVRVVDQLPRTSTDKVDLQDLMRLA